MQHPCSHWLATSSLPPEVWLGSLFSRCLSWQKCHVLHLSDTHVWSELPRDVKWLPFPENKRLVLFFHLPSQLSGLYWVLHVLLKTFWKGLYLDSSGVPATRVVILSYSNEPTKSLMYKVHVFHHTNFLISRNRCMNHKMLLTQLILFSDSIFIHVYTTFQQETPNI